MSTMPRTPRDARRRDADTARDDRHQAGAAPHRARAVRERLPRARRAQVVLHRRAVRARLGPGHGLLPAARVDRRRVRPLAHFVCPAFEIDKKEKENSGK